MKDDNGYVKMIHLGGWGVTLLGVIAGVVMWGVDQVAAVERRSVMRDEATVECMHKYIIPMSEDIAAIKMALNIRNDKS
jgi:hypothetical protein